MVDVRPFRAVYYDEKKIGSLERVIVPPYDVISKAEKKVFFKKSPYNFARIILGEKKDGYLSVGRMFRRWQKEKILAQSERENFYFWQQTFLKEKKRVSRYGIVAQVSLNDFRRGNILPHEKTFEAPKQDRLKILKECQANLSPVFMMYQDPTRILEKKLLKHCQEPFLKMKDSQHVVSKIWKIEDSRLEAFIRYRFLKKKLYIVDGHHRFATALGYSEKNSKKKGSHSILAVITNMSDPALVVYPIYRLLKKVKGFDKEKYLEGLTPWFHVRKMKGIQKLKRCQWGILFRNDPSYYVVTLKKGGQVIKAHSAVKGLDVFVLQQMIIPRKYESEIRYVRGMGARLQLALEDLRRGKYEAMWTVKAPTVEELKRVSDARQTMPAKSTFFYPKILSGLLIRCF